MRSGVSAWVCIFAVACGGSGGAFGERSDAGPRRNGNGTGERPDEIDGQPAVCAAADRLWDRPDRFLATRDTGESASAWRARRRVELARLFSLPLDPVGPIEVIERDAYDMDGTVRVQVLEVPSSFDGQPVQVLRVHPLEPDPDALPHVVFTLHGHDFGFDATLYRDHDLRRIGVELAERGAEVFSPGYRGDASHAAFTEDLEDGDFARMTVADLSTFLALARQLVPDRASTSIMGHSMGGYLSLHLAALRPELDAVYVSGLFVPLECMNSGHHHRCQKFGPVNDAFGTDDLAALVAPRRLGIYFGDQDIFYTPATEAVIEDARQVYGAQGEGRALHVQVEPDVPHRVNVQDVIDFLGAEEWMTAAD